MAYHVTHRQTVFGNKIGERPSDIVGYQLDAPSDIEALKADILSGKETEPRTGSFAWEPDSDRTWLLRGNGEWKEQP